MLIAQAFRHPTTMDPVAIVVVGLIAVVALAIGTVIGAVILRTACWLYNKAAGGEAVPEPSFAKAMLIAFLTAVVVSLLAAVVTFGAGLLGPSAKVRL
jgi:hypothetical protein